MDTRIKMIATNEGTHGSEKNVRIWRMSSGKILLERLVGSAPVSGGYIADIGNVRCEGQLRLLK